MNKEGIRFEIDQLRKDKIIYGLEAVATDLAVFLLIIVVGFLQISYSVSYPIVIGSGIVGIGYTVFMGIGNFKRLQKIKKLEKELRSK